MGKRRRSQLWIVCGVIVAAAALYLVGNHSVPLWDRDEPRYAQTSRQMLRSGDWIVPKLLDEPREKKPIFIYWCQATSMRVLGDNAFAARLPSAVFVTLTLLTLVTALWRTVGPRRAIWTTFIFATSGLTIAAAKMCITDGVLILFITAAQLCMYAFVRGRATWVTATTMGFAVGLALLTKGPVVLGVMLMTWLALGILRLIDRRWQALTPAFSQRPGRGGWRGIVLAGAIAIAVVSPWLYAIEKRLPGYTVRTLKAEVLDRAAKPQEGHKGPPGYYALTVWGTSFPWSLLLPATAVSAWKHRRKPAVRFAIAAVMGPWIMFEIVQTKLVHYLLPVFPALSFLTADMLVRASRRLKQQFAGRTFLRVVFIWGGLVCMLGVAPWLAVPYFGAQPMLAFSAMVLLPILAMEYARSIYVHFKAARPLDAAAVMGIGMMVLVAVIYALYLPSATYLQVSPRLANLLRADGATRPGDAIMIDYKETSLAFYQGGTIRPQRDNRYLSRTTPEQWPRWIVLTKEIWEQTPPEMQDRLDIVETVRGLNYADGGRIVDVLMLRKRYP